MEMMEGIGDDGRYLKYKNELPNEGKAKVLLPSILAASCLHLPSSHFKHIIQDVFGHLVFHSQSSLICFIVSNSGKAIPLF